MLWAGPGGTEGTSLGGRRPGNGLKVWELAAAGNATSHKPAAQTNGPKTNWAPRPRLVPAILMGRIFRPKSRQKQAAGTVLPQPEASNPWSAISADA
jgi:hypothetical protein